MIPRQIGRTRAASGLAAALLGLCLYAAFAHGAVAAGDEERLQLAVAAVAVVAVVSAVAWRWSGTLAVRAPRAGWIALGLLAAFAFWSGVTLLWSVAPDQTWIECNRAITYVIALGLAIALGALHPRAARLVADGFAVVALLVSLYAPGTEAAAGDQDRRRAEPRSHRQPAPPPGPARLLERARRVHGDGGRHRAVGRARCRTGLVAFGWPARSRSSRCW